MRVIQQLGTTKLQKTFRERVSTLEPKAHGRHRAHSVHEKNKNLEDTEDSEEIEGIEDLEEVGDIEVKKDIE